MAEPFLSASWYRVAGLKPRLRDHARVFRHSYHAKHWHVNQDELTGQTHRVTPAAYHLIGRMDGKSTVQDLWVEAVRLLGEHAPSQDDCIQLLAQLHAFDLLQCDLSP